MKRVATERILDKLHRGIVYGCIGLTLYGLVLGGFRVHRYYTVLVPLGEERRKAEALKLSEKDNNTEASVPKSAAGSEDLKY